MSSDSHRPVSPTNHLLRRSARRAYEFGRVRRGLRWSLLGLGPILLTVHESTTLGWLVASTLLVAGIGVAAWRGGSAERAVAPSLAVGAGALVCGAVVCSPAACLNSGWQLALWGGLGVLGGLLLSVGTRTDERPAHRFGYGALIAGAAGALGCAPMGVGAALLWLLGLWLVTGSVWAWRTQRSMVG